MANKINNLKTASGPIEFGLTNDYMFRVVFQGNMEALRGLICSVLHINPDDIREIVVCNPIEPGKSIEDKEFILDLKVKFNNNTIVNLEMQLINKGNWPERSLSYLCRNFDSLNKGSDYSNALSAIHIGFIDFTLFPKHPEFCATYMMTNIKNHEIYSSKFAIKVVELNQIGLATDEDQFYEIDKWARLFKSTTWEELKMYAENNAAMQSVVEEVYKYNSEETVRDMCRAREEAIAYQNYVNNKIKHLETEIEAKDAALDAKDIEISEKDAEIARLRQALAEKSNS